MGVAPLEYYGVLWAASGVEAGWAGWLCTATLASESTFSYGFAAGAAADGAVFWPMALVKAPMATMTANVTIVEVRALRVGESIIAEQ